MKSVWAMGFRPFFLLGALHAAILMPVWVFFFSGRTLITWPSPPIDWHAHEMIYGFATAIISGFLLTATQNWTGKRGLHGGRLQILVVLWLAGRIAPFLTLSSPTWIPALFSLPFFPVLLWLLLPYLADPSQKRNRIFVLLLSLLFTGHLLFFLQYLKVSENTARTGLYLGVWVILIMISVIGGRVIPFFTKNAIPSAKIKTPKWLDIASLVSIFILAVTYLFFQNTPLFYLACFAAFAVHLARWLSWDFTASLAKPILSILYIGYAWMVLGFLLLGFSALGWLGFSAALHALTAGTIGIMIFGMITRVSLGHTGRPIQASRLAVVGYVLINLATVIRVFGPILWPALYLKSIVLSGVLWSLAFAVFVLEYAPYLLQPRLDGKPG